MTIEMDRFNAALGRATFRPLNGKSDPFDVLSSVGRSLTDAHTMMTDAGVLGWAPELIPLSGMDSGGNIYEAPANTRGIVVPQYPGGPAFFGTAGDKYPFIRPEALVPLIDAIAAHGNPLTGIAPGPVTRFFFDSKLVELAPYSAQARAMVGEVIKIRWQLALANTGRASLKISQNGVRLICANGCTTNDTLGSVSISHTSLAPRKIEATVQRILTAGNLGLDKWIEDARRTIAQRVTLDRALQMWGELFGWDADKDGRSRTIQENQVATLTQLWRADTQTVTYPHTGWAFFNATTEYLDHEATVRTGGESRTRALARRVVEGAPAVEATKTRAWEMALAG